MRMKRAHWRESNRTPTKFATPVTCESSTCLHYRVIGSTKAHASSSPALRMDFAFFAGFGLLPRRTVPLAAQHRPYARHCGIAGGKSFQLLTRARFGPATGSELKTLSGWAAGRSCRRFRMPARRTKINNTWSDLRQDHVFEFPPRFLESFTSCKLW